MKEREDLKKDLAFILDEYTSSVDSNIHQKLISKASKAKAEKEQANWKNLDEQTKDLANKRFASDTQKRNTLSTWAATLVSLWLISVLLILVGNTSTYKLESNVLVALLATTTLNVLGLMYIVLKGLFGENIKRD